MSLPRKLTEVHFVKNWLHISALKQDTDFNSPPTFLTKHHHPEVLQSETIAANRMLLLFLTA